jgi:hypothetical protein
MEGLDIQDIDEVEIDDLGGGICWPNGYDICPNYLRGIIEKENKRIVKSEKMTSAIDRKN